MWNELLNVHSFYFTFFLPIFNIILSAKNLFNGLFHYIQNKFIRSLFPKYFYVGFFVILYIKKFEIKLYLKFSIMIYYATSLILTSLTCSIFSHFVFGLIKHFILIKIQEPIKSG